MTDLWKRITLGAAMVGAVAAVVYVLPAPLQAAPATKSPTATGMMSGGMMSGGMMSGGMMSGGMGGMMNGNMGQMHSAMSGMYQRALDAVASTLGISADDLSKAVKDGRKLADLAKEKDIDVAKINSAVLSAHQAALDDLVKAGTVTREQADQMLKQMNGVDFVTMFDGGPMGGSGGCHGSADDSGTTA
ncbi:MAG TPA: hypothetical protein VGK74_03370 [Symbiobacteriaceae bacterium]|jgi:hypothetical protein